MKIWIFVIGFVFCLSYTSLQLFADTSEDSLCAASIAKETLDIQRTPPYDHTTLSDLHASRGEDYLILGEDQKALEDFQCSYEYALICKKEEEKDLLLFRPLFGFFLVYARLEDLESAREIYAYLESILKRHTYSNCRESFSHIRNPYFDEDIIPITSQDWPILGPEKVPIGDCLERVKNTVQAVSLLIAAVKKTEVRALALLLINQLADSANGCCRAGGLWKGCLQKLVNKLHYWKAFGIPANPAWD